MRRLTGWLARSRFTTRWSALVVESFIRGIRQRGWRIVKINPNLVVEMDEWITDELTEDDLEELL